VITATPRSTAPPAGGGAERRPSVSRSLTAPRGGARRPSL